MFTLFKSSQQSQQQRLPAEFAEKLLNLELDVELPSVTEEAVNELLQLYSQAIEFYSSLKSDKYVIFTNKIQALMQKQHVSALFRSRDKQQTQKKSLIQPSHLVDNEKQVQQLMTAAQDNQQKCKTLIEDDFKMQDHRVQQRMLQRIKDPNKYNQAISKSTSLRHLQLDLLNQQQLENKDENSKPVVQYENNPKQHCKTDQDEEIYEPIQIDQQSFCPQLGDLSHPKTKKVREMVNKNSMLKKQKSELNNFLPY